MTDTTHFVDQLTIAATGDLQLAVTRAGTGTAPVTVLYVHGLVADSSFWQPLIGHLVPRLGEHADHVAFDARGHGLSQRPPRASANTLTALAADLAAVIDSFDGPVLLVAHSMGAFVVFEYARRHREAFDARVRSLLMFNAAGEFPEWVQLQPFRRAAAKIRPLRRTVLDPVNAAAHTFLQNRLVAMTGRAKPGRAQMVPAVRPVDSRVTADICTAVEGFQLDAALIHTLAGRPVQVVTAQYDRAVPPTQSQHLTRRIPGATLKFVENAGHSFALSHPEIASEFVLTALADINADVVTAQVR